jgi:putative DNA primase/helicase
MQHDTKKLWNDARPVSGVDIVKASLIKPEAYKWLWPGWLAGGKLHILGGIAGTAKTTIALSFAAILSRGGKWPDGTQAPPAESLIWSGEDDPADTIIPRLMAMGADLSKIQILRGMNDSGGKRPFDPGKDIDALCNARLDGVKLLICDPVVSAVPGDSHKNAEVRRGLQPLVDLTSRLGCATVGITHFSKGTSGRDPLERITGSLAFGALARLVMCTAKPSDEEAARRLIRAKSNIGPDGGGFQYDLIRKEVETGIEGQGVTWGAFVDGTARDLVGAVEDDSDNSAQGKAEAFLDRILADGERPARELYAEAELVGISERTLKRAKSSMGILTRKEGNGPWFWSKGAKGSNKIVGTLGTLALDQDEVEL